MKKIKKLKVNERDILRSVMDWLALKRLFFWRNQAGAIVGNYKGKNWFVRLGKEGSSDLFVLKKGQLYGLEIKSPTGQMSESQEKFQKEFEKNGGTYLLVRGIEDLENYGLF